MRGKRFDFESFKSELCYQLVSFCEKNSEKLSRSVPTLRQDFENRLRLLSRRKSFLMMLCIFSWYCPPDLGVLIRLEVEEVISKWENSDEIRALLHSKTLMLMFFRLTNKWSTRDFWGNIICEKNLKLIWILVRPVMKPRSTPRKTVRRRGYRDKGFLKLPHKIHEDVDMRSEQLKLEEQRSILQGIILFTGKDIKYLAG